ncbi:acyltransferase [Anaeromyxobacter sp. PSR-1]|uniref:acyltransferase family protein n=1 Tax=unclassified Anaeromyxobacter TaxID=2620896 RepID=UPI0005E74F5B|nr:acyltransferase [Anaeromyxobacter sp. PSR-1]GAO02185.1 glucans biosynthesis protein [Anaeromyxobacter sp. PSR-1]
MPTEVTPTGYRSEPRRADLDWLRVLGMLAVFLVHAAEPFNPWDTWHVQSALRSKWLGELVFFPAPWIMPLFMALAGEAAWLALRSRSPARYVRERLLRLGLPLVLGILVLVPPQVWVERRLQGRFDGSLLAFYPHFFDGIYPDGNFAWHNLWFLVFLLAFSLATAPLLARLRAPAGRRLLARLAAPCQGPAGLAWLVLPAVAIRILTATSAPGFPPLAYDWSNRGLLLPAFLWGFAVAAEPGFAAAVDRHWRPALAIAVAASVGLCAWAWPGDVLARLPAARSAGGVLLWGGYGCASWCWLVALLGGARRFLAHDGEALQRASGLVYPFYVLHHGVIVALAAAMVRRGADSAGLPAAFVGLAAASLAISVALCWVVAAWEPLRLVFGLRSRHRSVVREPVPLARDEL